MGERYSFQVFVSAYLTMLLLLKGKNRRLVLGSEITMMELSNKKIAEFFHRSCMPVDGVWFMKVEGKCDFGLALGIDDEG